MVHTLMAVDRINSHTCGIWNGSYTQLWSLTGIVHTIVTCPIPCYRKLIDRNRSIFKSWNIANSLYHGIWQLWLYTQMRLLTCIEHTTLSVNGDCTNNCGCQQGLYIPFWLLIWILYTMDNTHTCGGGMDNIRTYVWLLTCIVRTVLIIDQDSMLFYRICNITGLNDLTFNYTGNTNKDITLY